jgi:hypothetical protein
MFRLSKPLEWRRQKVVSVRTASRPAGAAVISSRLQHSDGSPTNVRKDIACPECNAPTMVEQAGIVKCCVCSARV